MTLPPAYGQGGAGGAGGGGGLDWTSAEQDTGLTYLGGKTVFQKTVIRAAALAAGATSTSFAHGISTIDELISYTAVVQRSNGDYLPMPLGTPSSGFQIEVRVDGTNIVITPGTGWTATGTEILSDATITLFYTKV